MQKSIINRFVNGVVFLNNIESTEKENNFDIKAEECQDSKSLFDFYFHIDFIGAAISATSSKHIITIYYIYWCHCNLVQYIFIVDVNLLMLFLL